MRTVNDMVIQFANGNTDLVIDWLSRQSPAVVALFCFEFVYGTENASLSREYCQQQLGLICTRLTWGR